MTKVADPRAASPLALKALALVATAFTVHYYVLHDVLGLLAVDEIYFAHVFWLLRSGFELYSDFFENHWPTYVYLLAPMLPGGGDQDLTFVWWLRTTGAAAAIAYVGLLWGIARRDFLFLMPFLFLFLTFGRMTEIRPDIVGLLLFNAGWWLLIREPTRRNMLLAAILAVAALSFSARAAVMSVGLGLLLAYLCAQKRDWRTLRMLLALGAALFACALAAYFADPDAAWRMISLIYLEPAGITPEIPLWQRLLPLDRLFMVILIAAALAAAAWRRTDRRAPVVLFACATQLILILVDPAPYQYVYGWAAIPTLAGLSLFGDAAPKSLHRALAVSGFAIAIAAAGLSLAGPTPRPGSMLRLTYDRPFAAGELQRASTAELLRLATTTERQEGAWNQLALFAEICRRIDSPVLTKFYANLICLPDARYDWPGLKWSPIFEDDSSTVSRAEFEQLFASRPPALVAWGKQHYVPRLNPWGRALLANYDIYDGYALRRPPQR